MTWITTKVWSLTQRQTSWSPKSSGPWAGGCVRLGFHRSRSQQSTYSARLGQQESALTGTFFSLTPRPSSLAKCRQRYLCSPCPFSPAAVGSSGSHACDSLFLTRPHIASLSLAPTHPPDSSQRSFPAGAGGQEWGCRIRNSSATEQQQQNGLSKQGPFHPALIRPLETSTTLSIGYTPV